jgi:hypothetical protein
MHYSTILLHGLVVSTGLVSGLPTRSIITDGDVLDLLDKRDPGIVQSTITGPKADAT